MDTKSGFVVLLGRPNVGKSTLLNAIIKEKVAIVTPTVQTTRNQILGIYNDEDSQIVFVDTPGIHKPKNMLGESLNKASFSALYDNEVTLIVIDANEEIGPGDRYIIEKVKNKKTPTILVINKIDLIKKTKIIEIINKWQKEMEFSEIVPVSSLENNNIDTLINVIKNYLPQGPFYYPRDSKSGQSLDFEISEIIREKAILLTKEEIPHSIAVVIEEIINNKDKMTINAAIIVDRDSKKGILIGKNGLMLKNIGSNARRELEEKLNKKVNLILFVKTKDKWREKKSNLKDLGYYD